MKDQNETEKHILDIKDYLENRPELMNRLIYKTTTFNGIRSHLIHLFKKDFKVITNENDNVGTITLNNRIGTFLSNDFKLVFDIEKFVRTNSEPEMVSYIVGGSV